MYRLLALLSLVLFASACGGDLGEPCTRSAEVCDGVDNDCDGDVDEGFELSQTCEVGQGECAVLSVTVCNEAGDGVVCGVDPADAAVELCGDDIDNDCDGEVDEGFETLGNECTDGLGVCTQKGQIVCSEDLTEAVCSNLATAPPEADEVSCDALDNDCDGDVDEGCDDDEDTWCEQGFTALAGGPCTGGEGDCDDTNPDIFPGSTIPGCDGTDNDCDGQQDELQLVPGSDTTASLMVNADATDTVGGPGVLIAPMDGAQYCGAASSQGNASLQFFFVVLNDTEPAVRQAGSVAALDVRLIDIVAETDRCTVLYGYDDGGTDRLAIARSNVGTTTPEGPVDVSGDVMVLTSIWAGALYARSSGNYNIFGMTSASSGTGRIYRRSISTSNSSYDGGSVLLQHIAMAPDSSGLGLDDLLLANTFGGTRFWTSDIRNFSRVEPWETTFQMLYPDIHQIGTTTFQTGHDGSTFHVRTLDAESGATVPATGSEASVTDRDYMTRHQLFEGPAGSVYAIDAAADQVYRLEVGGASIAFESVDLAPLGEDAEVVAGKSLGAESFELLTLARPSTAVEFTSWSASCF